MKQELLPMSEHPIQNQSVISPSKTVCYCCIALGVPSPTWELMVKNGMSGDTYNHSRSNGSCAGWLIEGLYNKLLSFQCSSFITHYIYAFYHEK